MSFLYIFSRNSVVSPYCFRYNVSMEVLGKQIEQQNQLNVLRCIEEMHEVSRAAIAKQLGLSRTTVSSAVARLIEAELVEECNQVGELAGPGRPGIPLALRNGTWYAAGAAFIDRELLFVLTDLSGRIVDRFALRTSDATADTFLKTLGDGFEALIKRCPGKLLPMLGVGSPGMVNHGRIVEASDMGWTDVRIADYLYQRLGLPSTVVNRHWASCISEYHFGAGKDVKSQIYVGISTGIAAAIIIDGKLFTGAYHSAGEIGHMVVERNGPVCSCGRRGCLHAISSENAMIRHLTEHYAAHPEPVFEEDSLWKMYSSGQPLDIGSVCHAARNGHPIARSNIERAGFYMGFSIANLISMFNPQCVILGGSFIEHGGEMLQNLIIDSVREHAREATLVAVDLCSWALGRYSGALGAAILVLENKHDLALACMDRK